MELCERHNRLRCGECSYIEQLEEENKELKEKLERVQKIIGAMFYRSEWFYMDDQEEMSNFLNEYRMKLSKAINYPE